MRTYTHIHTYTHIAHTPNNKVKEYISYNNKKVLRTPLVIVIIPLLFFLFIAFDYFSRSERALQSKLSGNLLTSSFACKTRRQQAAKVIKRVYVCFVSEMDTRKYQSEPNETTE